MTTTASDIASLDAASGLLALISAASSSNDLQKAAVETTLSSCPVSPQVVVEQRRQSVTVSDISDDDDESKGESLSATSAHAHPNTQDVYLEQPQQHQTKKAYRAKLGRPIGSSSFPVSTSNKTLTRRFNTSSLKIRPGPWVGAELGSSALMALILAIVDGRER